MPKRRCLGELRPSSWDHRASIAVAASLAIACLASAPARAQESDAIRCRDGVDDDGDGAVDCMDSECSLFVFCAQAGYAPRPAVIAPGYAPAPTVTTTHPNWVLVAIGFPLFGLAWVLDIAVTGATTETEESFYWSLCPLAGAWVQLEFADNEAQVALLVIDGLSQITGLVLGIVGLAVQQTSESPAYALGGGAELVLLPWAGPGTGGLTAALRM